MSTHGFADVARAYLDAGWHPFPLPRGEKSPPPSGATGRDGKDPTVDDVDSWCATHADANIGVRMPAGVVGVDVDHYDAKTGADTLLELEVLYGELPATWSSTSRGAGPSRIHFFRVDPDVELPGTLGKDIEAIQRHHRFAVVAPSTRRDTGGRYRWYQPDGEPAGRPPRPDELAWLPAAWVDALSLDRPTPLPPSPAQPTRLDGDSIAEQINRDHHWHDVLAGDGWQLHHQAGDLTHWTRPGKDARGGTSAVLHEPDGPFVVFTTSVPELQQPWAESADRTNWSYSMFGYLAATRHHGDRSQCAREARLRSLAADARLRSMPAAGTPPDADPPAGDDQPYTVLGNARRLVAEHGDDLRHVPQWSAWLTWDGARWTEDHTGEVHRRAKQIVDDFPGRLASIGDADERKRLFGWWMRSQSPAVLGGMVQLAATEPGIPVLVDRLDADHDVLNTASGAVDLRTGALHPAARDQLCTKLAAVRHDPGADCSQWKEFVRWAMCGDDELVSFVQRAVGYTLTGDVGEQVLFFLHGGGQNGKSTFLAVLQRLLGDYAFSAEADLLLAVGHERHSTGIADLHGRRMVIVQEIDEGRRLDEALVKRLTGGDAITARRMRQDNFMFQPTHKLWMAANHKPVVRGTDHAIWRRIRLIPFAATIADADKDPRLVERLIATEGPGILNWALHGCLDWRRQGLRPPASVLDATKDYRTEQDHVGRFLEACCTLAPGLRIATKDLRAAYEKWCFEEGEKPWSARAMASQLQERGCTNEREAGGRTRLWQGLALSGDAAEELSRRLQLDDWSYRATGERPEHPSQPVTPVDNCDAVTSGDGSSVTPHAHAPDWHKPENSSQRVTASHPAPEPLEMF